MKVVHPLAWAVAFFLGGAALAAPAKMVDWPMERGNRAGTARVQIDLVPGGTAAAKVKGWRFEAGRHVWGYQPGISVWSSPALGVVAGRPLVLVGSYDRNLYALDAVSGEKRWSFTTGGGIYSAPALWGGGRRERAHCVRGLKRSAALRP